MVREMAPKSECLLDTLLSIEKAMVSAFGTVREYAPKSERLFGFYVGDGEGPGVGTEDGRGVGTQVGEVVYCCAGNGESPNVGP